MKWIIALLVLVGIVAALCAAVLVASLRASAVDVRLEQAPEPTEMDVLVATRDLPAMTVVDASAIAAKRVMSDVAPEGARTSATMVVGQVLVQPLVAGEVLTASHFATEESGVHVAAALPEGRRAMSTLLTMESGIEDMLYPGCVVDVVASFRLPTVQGRPSGAAISATLLQSVQVLAVGPRSIVSRAEGEAIHGTGAADRKRQRMVTLMVDPDQAEALQLANAYGEVTVALRNPLDGALAPGRGVLLSDLSEEIADRLASVASMGGYAPMFVDDESPRPDAADAPAEPAPAPGPRLWTTTVLRGGDAETMTFPLEEER